MLLFYDFHLLSGVDVFSVFSVRRANIRVLPEERVDHRVGVFDRFILCISPLLNIPRQCLCPPTNIFLAIVSQDLTRPFLRQGDDNQKVSIKNPFVWFLLPYSDFPYFRPMKKIQDNEVRWGILGVGNVCEVKSAPAMNLVPDSKVVAVMRRNEEKVKDYAKRHGVSKWYTDAQSLINDPEVNAIYIATPPNAHLELTKLAAESGKPVYVEKPMARTYAECLEMIAVCEAAGVPLYVAYYRRSLPHFVKMKELIDAGTIGEVRTLHINMKQELKPEVIVHLNHNWRVDPEIAGGGYFYDLASHQLDYLDFLLGPIEQARGFAANQAGAYAAEDIVAGSFRFENGIIGTGNWCFTTSKEAEIDDTVIYGSKGYIRYQTFGKGEFELVTQEKGREVFAFELPSHIQQHLINNITCDILGKDQAWSTGNSAARTNWVMDELTRKG